MKNTTQFKVALKESEEGFAVWCPGLPGCWSQGVTREEALENIQEAIELYLEAAEALAERQSSQTASVTVCHA